MIMVLLFFLFFVVCVNLEYSNSKQRNVFLAFSCMALAFMAGLRDLSWADSGVYAESFFRSPNLFHFSFSDTPYGYSEYGFYLIGVIVKTFTTNYHFFFLVVSFLSFYFINKGLKELSVFPLIGLCAYVSRFIFGRHFIQVRAGLAYAILMLGIKYIYKKDWKRYFLIVFVAWLFHRSAIIGVPLYFFCNWVKVKKWHIVIVLIVSFLIGIFGQGFMHTLVEDNASDLNIVSYSEAGGDSRQLSGLGILNPMIYFQSLILLAYTFLEEKLSKRNKLYYVIRTAYLYSTVILICFCSYKVLSARTSTVYATLEFAIIPSMIYLFNKKNRMFSLWVTGIVLTGIFYMYYNLRVK